MDKELILLQKDAVYTNSDSLQLEGFVTLSLAFYPSPWINIKFTANTCDNSSLDFMSSGFFLNLDQSHKISLLDSDEEILNITYNGFRADENKFNINFTPTTPSSLIIGNEQTVVDELSFEIFNFCNLFTLPSIGSLAKDLTSLNLNLDFDNWVIRLNPTSNIREQYKSISEEGGYKITHNLSIRKNNGTNFSATDINKLVSILTLALSFIEGRPISLCSCKGYNNKKIVLLQMNRPMNNGFNRGRNWFRLTNTQDISYFIKNFALTYNSNKLQNILNTTIKCYCEANSSVTFADNAIMICQSSLELLAETYINIKCSPSEKKRFKKLKSAAEKISMFMEKINIPVGLEQVSDKIQKVYKPSSSIDLLTKVRNSIAHQNKNTGTFNDVLVDISFLYMWYLELSILAICNYSGKYHDRRKILINGSHIEKAIPWNI